MGLNVCMRETFLELTHIYVRHLFADTGVSQKLDSFSLWCVDCPIPKGVSDDAEAILLKLGDGEGPFQS